VGQIETLRQCVSAPADRVGERGVDQARELLGGHPWRLHLDPVLDVALGLAAMGEVVRDDLGERTAGIIIGELSTVASSEQALELGQALCEHIERLAPLALAGLVRTRNLDVAYGAACVHRGHAALPITPASSTSFQSVSGFSGMRTWTASRDDSRVAKA